MKSQFFALQSEESKKVYIELLQVTGSLSNLFAESKNPFLYYRAMENIFCRAFDARNLSRSDVSADAGKDGVGVGLKTFLQNNGNTFQKVAEFNKESYLLRNLTGLDLVRKVSSMRNERIITTMKICNLQSMMYHLVTRSDNHMAIYEEDMDLVDIHKLRITTENTATIHFTDNIHDYSFSLSKNTLLKRFITKDSYKIYGFDVEILEDPFRFLLSRNAENRVAELSCMETPRANIEDFIVLPLYSPRSKKVEERSGLNQWNAAGRPRNDDEVYISVPKWIHHVKKGFFKYNTEDNKTDTFDVILPNGEKLNMRIAQQGGKALMSNPNSALGKWILRDILSLKKGVLITKEQLDIIGIDSVRLSKDGQGKYYLDFLKLGSYEKFEALYNYE